MFNLIQEHLLTINDINSTTKPEAIILINYIVKKYINQLLPISILLPIILKYNLLRKTNGSIKNKTTDFLVWVKSKMQNNVIAKFEVI